MNTATLILLLSQTLLFLPACNQVAPKSQASPSILANANIETQDSTLPQKLPRLTGEWVGFGTDKGRSFSWTVINGELTGVYFAKKKTEEDYSKVFRFNYEKGVICCYPCCYKCGCGTPDGTYRLTEQTDSSYTFVADHGPVVKTISTLQFSFLGENQMVFSRKHDYADYPDHYTVRRFRRK